MGMNSWSEQGYGVKLFTGENFGAIKKFIAERTDDIEDKQAILSAEDEDELYDICGDPVSWVVAEIIRDETGYNSFIGFMACGDTNFEDHIGFTTDFPWRFGEKDRKLTLEVAQKLIEKYAKELEIDEVPEYFEAEYFG